MIRTETQVFINDELLTNCAGFSFNSEAGEFQADVYDGGEMTEISAKGVRRTRTTRSFTLTCVKGRLVGDVLYIERSL